MIPIFANDDTEKPIGCLAEGRQISFNHPIDFELFELKACVSFICEKQDGKVLNKNQTSKLEYFYLCPRKDKIANPKKIVSKKKNKK